MDLEAVITGLHRTSGKIDKFQLTRIAHFDCDIGPFQIRGCTLLKADRTGDYTAWMPRLADARNPAGNERQSLTITDRDLLKRLAEAALRAYRALGGRE